MRVISEAFNKLKPDKQKKIIDAAMEEFAGQGYMQASTNTIVKKAGIGKGMLFYYFKSKKELYYYLIDYGLKYMKEEYLPFIDEEEGDFIKRYNQVARLKMEAYNKNPHIFNFFGNIIINKENPLPEELKAKIEAVSKEAYAKLFTNLDISLFRDDLPSQKALNLMRWSMDGYSEEIIKRLRGQNMAEVDFAPMWEEFYEYTALLRKVFYKQNMTGGKEDGDSANK